MKFFVLQLSVYLLMILCGFIAGAMYAQSLQFCVWG